MQVFLGLGSNMDPEKHIDFALLKLSRAFGPLSQSSRYKTQALGFEGPSFINMVVGLDTRLSPKAVALKCQELEVAVGRVRSGESGNCSRTIDIDMLLFIDDNQSDLPEPRADIRDFAYAAMPLAELIPRWQHPLIGGLSLSEYVELEVQCGVFSRQEITLLK